MPKVNPPVTVRRLRESDRADWMALWQGYLSFYREQLPEAVTERTFARLSAGESGMLGLVATGDDDRPVGFAHLVLHAGTWEAGPVCYLEDLFVAREARGGEVAPALFDAVFAAARTEGCERVYWQTQAFNAPARSLYDTVGHLQSRVLYERQL